MKIQRLFVILLTLGLLFSTQQQPVLAQNPQPPIPGNPDRGPDGMWFDAQANAWMSNGEVNQLDRVERLSSGGPDGYGYTWNDSIPLSWIDATNGTRVGLSGYSSGLNTGPISLPFEFKYYENSYTNLIIAASGYVAFSDGGSWPWQPRVPSPSLPNNIIAPYATPLNLASSGSTNRIYYKSGGSAPNRYFVVEWYQVKWNDETYTFEVILHENGDIVFQFQQMTYVGGYSCGTAGIEDSLGLEGLAYTAFCQQAPSNKAVRFYRPASGPHTQVYPLNQGSFTSLGSISTFNLNVRNNGETGSDTYNLSVSSTWLAAVLDYSTGLPLSDTNSDGAIDTGSLAQGAQKTVQVKVQSPLSGNVGDSNTVTLTVLSSLDPTKSKTTILRSAIPAPFGQVYRDEADGAMSMSLVQPSGQKIVKAAPDWTDASDMAVVEKPDGFAYFWSRYDYCGTYYCSEIEFTFLDRAGNLTRGVSKLTDHSAATMNTYDDQPVLAVAPNGRIGVTWVRYLWNNNISKFQYNLFFAVLDSSGNLVYGPANVTNNSTWSSGQDQSYQYYRSPDIVATADNSFTIAWERETYVSSDWLDDVFYTVRDTNGGTLKPLTQLTNDTPGGGQYYESPTLAALSGNRVFMAWEQNGQEAMEVFNSAGVPVYGPTVMNLYGYDLDAVQLSGGRILIAAEYWNLVSTVNFVVLDGSSYNLLAGPVAMENPVALTGNAYIAVSADASNHAILTWMDADYYFRQNLYYALVDGSGSVVTTPMIFQSSQNASRIDTSYQGLGNTSYNVVMPTSPNVDLKATAPAFSGGVPGGSAGIEVSFQNDGAGPATAVVLSATLDNALSYLNASPAPTSVVGNVVTWNLMDVGFQGKGKVTLVVTLPPAAGIGTLFPITCEISSAGPEAAPANNSITVNVMESLQGYLPLIGK